MMPRLLPNQEDISSVKDTSQEQERFYGDVRYCELDKTGPSRVVGAKIIAF